MTIILEQRGSLSYRQQVENSLQALESFYDLSERLYPDEELEEQDRSVLASFAGGGALWRLFRPSISSDPEWEKAARIRLKTILKEDDYSSLQRSITTAYYTPEPIVVSIWEALISAGFDGGKVLDPGCGATLNFLRFCPPELREKIQYVGVEQDELSCKIAQRLFPKAKIYNKDFMLWAYPTESFDLVIGNVPFDNGVHTSYGDFQYPVGLHARFFLKSADMVKPGGVIALMSSTGTLDSAGQGQQFEKCRRHLDARLVFGGAVRLPCEAFASVGTNATTDTLFLQRRQPGREQQSRPWFRALPTEILSYKTNLPTRQNEYFSEYPDHAIGDIYLDQVTADKCGRTCPQEDLIIPKFRAAVGEILGSMNPFAGTKEQDAADVLTEEQETTKGDNTMYMRTSDNQRTGNVSAVAAWRKFKISHNKEKNGLELRFPVQPPAPLREDLNKTSFNYEEAGRNRVTELRYFRMGKNREADPRWVVKICPASVDWMISFARTEGHQVDLGEILPIAQELGIEWEDAPQQPIPLRPRAEKGNPEEQLTPEDYELLEQLEAEPEPSEVQPIATSTPGKKRSKAKPKEVKPAQSTQPQDDFFSLLGQLCEDVLTGIDLYVEEHSEERKQWLADIRKQADRVIKDPSFGVKHLSLVYALTASTYKTAVQKIEEAVAEAKEAIAKPSPVKPSPVKPSPVVQEPIEELDEEEDESNFQPSTVLEIEEDVWDEDDEDEEEVLIPRRPAVGVPSLGKRIADDE